MEDSNKTPSELLYVNYNVWGENILDRINERLNIVGERINDLKHIVIETIQKKIENKDISTPLSQ